MNCPGKPMELDEFFEKTIELEKHPLIAITGGGGKTSLMFAAAKFLSQKGRVVTTTTAKILSPDGTQSDGTYFVSNMYEAAGLVARMPERGVITLVKAVHENKLIGFKPPEADTIAQDTEADWVIVEADGSRGLPLKAYESWEPPVPLCVSCQLIVLGADLIGNPLDSSRVFRPELICDRFNVEMGEILTAEKVAEIVSSEDEYLKNSPPDAKRILMVNRADLVDKDLCHKNMLELAKHIKGYDLMATLSVIERKVYCLTNLSRE
jgi:probable selenium-dependent hydroxylase accessory protein YqeC